MYSAALQRYYNEHEHLPYTFYAQPKRFTQYAIEKRGELLATAYNYIEPDAKGTRDFVEYSSADFTVTDFHSADRVCVVMRLPEPTMPLHCKMIGCSVKFDGSCPVWRTVELTEQGSFLLCGWNADHTHMVISEVGAETEECVRRMTEELSFSQPRIKNDGLCFDISDKIVVDVNVAFFVIVHGIAFADLNFLNQAHQRGTV